MSTRRGARLWQMVLIGAPAWRRLALSCGLGVAAAAATVGLLAGSGYLVARAAFRPGLGAIAGLLALVEVMAFVRAPLRYGERLSSHDVAMRALVRWRVWLFDRLEPLAPAGLRHWRSGDLLNRAIGDVDALQDLYVGTLTPVVVTITVSLLAVVVVGVLLPLGGLILAVALVVALALSSALAIVNGNSEAREAALRGELSAEVVDLLQSTPELLVFGQHTAALERIDAADDAIARCSLRRGAMGAWASAIVVLCAGGAALAILGAAVSAFEHHHLSADLVAALPLAAIGAFEAVPPVVGAAHRVSGLLAAGDRLFALAAIPTPVCDPPQPQGLPSGYDVAVDGARLRYGSDLPWALDGLSMAVHPGERVALRGPSGSGKSSLANVLLRFWALEGGDATLDGVALERLAQADVRQVIGLVEQDARLFAGSIRYNVTLARPRADDGQVRRVLELAQLTAWVDALPEGDDTPVGEEGSQLSGGQRQRIALARTLLADPVVLILDEPTAGLDRATAQALLSDVLAATGERSVLLITHHEDEVTGCNRIVTIEAGRVVGGP